MKIGIIGAGSVGSATAFALVMQGISGEIVLIDYNKEKAIAEATDISHATSFSNSCKVFAGDYKDLKNAGIVIITAGANQKPGETRTDLLKTNVKIFDSIVPNIVENAPNCIIVVASNPVDVMAHVTLKMSGFPKNRVISSGTILDSSRFRELLGNRLDITAKSVHANVLGEHGDSEVLIWSTADAANTKVIDLAKKLNRPITEQIKAEVDDDVRNAAYKIIKGKGATFYGIAGGLAKICKAIDNDERSILTVSSLLDEALGIKDVFISYPCIVGKNGIEKVITPEFDSQEEALLRKSINIVKENTNIALSLIK